MKRNLTITKVLIALIGLALSSCSAWHYKNPRVNIDREKTIEINRLPTSPVEFAVIPIDRIKQVDKMKLRTTGDVNISNNKSGKGYLATVKNNKLPNMAKTIDNHSKPPFKLLIPQMKKKTNQDSEVKQVKIFSASGWVRIMIILFIVGFILLLLGIFLSAFVFGPLWWLFYAFGALLIAAGFVVLILGLLGLI